MNTNKRMTAIVLAIVIAGASLAACAAHQANTDIDIPETTTAGEETTTVPETTAGLTVTVTNDTATEPETETLSADRTERQETTTKSGTATTTKKTNTATTTKQTVTTTKRQTITTTKPVTTTKKPVTTTKRQTANTTTTKPVTTTKPKPTTTTTKPAPSTPTKAQIDKIVSDARAYGESLGMGWNSSLTIGNSSWMSPANTQHLLSLERTKQNVYYQIKEWAKIFKDEGGIDGAPAFKVVSKKLSDGNYEIYVLIG